MKSLVEQLKYAAGNDEGLGGYCEALIINEALPNFKRKRYVLHRYGEVLKPIELDQWGNPIKYRIEGEHEKIEFRTKKELLKAFPGIYLIEWQETNECCGYNIPKEEFKKAHNKRFEREQTNT